MRTKLKILSLTTALLLLGGAAVVAGPGGDEGPGRRGPGDGPGGGLHPRLMAELDLTDEQRAAIRAVVERHRDGELGEKERSLEQARRQLRALIHDAQADEQQVLAAARIVSARHETIALERHRMVQEINGLLTEEQQAQARELRERRGDRPRHQRQRRHDAHD